MQALESAEAAGRPVQLVLLDQRMPGVDGVECLQRLRALPLRRPPAVVLMPGMLAGEEVPSRLAAEQPERRRDLVQAGDAGSLLQACVGRAGPCAPRPAPTPQPATGRASQLDRLHGRRVLLVEDNPINQEVAR